MRQFVVLMPRVTAFKLRHPVEESQQHLRSEHRRVNLLVTQFSKKTAITVVCRSVRDTKISDGVIERVCINVVDNLSLCPVRDVEERAYHQVMAIFETVRRKAWVRFVSSSDLTVAIRRIVMLDAHTVGINEIPVWVSVKDFAFNDLGWHLHQSASGKIHS